MEVVCCDSINIRLKFWVKVCLHTINYWSVVKEK
jgi:hypothetical protein